MITTFQLLVALGFCVLGAVVVYLMIKTKSQARILQQQLYDLKQEQITTSAQSFKRQQQSIKLVEQENLEQHRMLQQLDESVVVLQQAIQGLNQQLEELHQRDPEVKLYQQAKQLIAAGSDIDEVVESCGIPRAEAELLFSLSHPSSASD